MNVMAYDTITFCNKMLHNFPIANFRRTAKTAVTKSFFVKTPESQINKFIGVVKYNTWQKHTVFQVCRCTVSVASDVVFQRFSIFF